MRTIIRTTVPIYIYKTPTINIPVKTIAAKYTMPHEGNWRGERLRREWLLQQVYHKWIVYSYKSEIDAPSAWKNDSGRRWSGGAAYYGRVSAIPEDGLRCFERASPITVQTHRKRDWTIFEYWRRLSKHSIAPLPHTQIFEYTRDSTLLPHIRFRYTRICGACFSRTFLTFIVAYRCVLRFIHCRLVQLEFS